VLFYGTSAVFPEDGTLHFAQDIYDLDRALDQTLP
jgi:murein L,D-transpeptidase YcbB/YkuD